jgi:hypothetical protein
MSRSDFVKMIKDLGFKGGSTKWIYKYGDQNIKIEDDYVFYILFYNKYQTTTRIPININNITEQELIGFCRRFNDENLFKSILRERKIVDILD